MKKIFLSILFSLVVWTLHGRVSTAEWQWSVKVKGFVANETNNEPDAFLWIPPTCGQVRAVLIGQHNMSEEDLFENSLFRQGMEDLGFALIWITPGISMDWDVKQGVQEYLEQLLNDLSETSGYSELRFAPVVPIPVERSFYVNGI